MAIYAAVLLEDGSYLLQEDGTSHLNLEPEHALVYPGLFTSSSSFYAASVTGSYDLFPDQYTNTQSFYSPTAAPGVVNLAPSRYDNTQTFYSATVAPGVVNLQPGRYDNSATFYTPTVTPGAIALTAALVVNSPSFYAPTAAYTEYRYARPDSDVSAGAWLPSSGGDLFAMIDEDTPSDADYVYTSSASTCEIALHPVVDPGASVAHTVRYRVRSDQGSTIVITLKQGATTIASDSQVATGTWTTYTLDLSGPETDAITNYADLRVTLEAA